MKYESIKTCPICGSSHFLPQALCNECGNKQAEIHSKIVDAAFVIITYKNEIANALSKAVREQLAKTILWPPTPGGNHEENLA